MKSKNWTMPEILERLNDGEWHSNESLELDPWLVSVLSQKLEDRGIPHELQGDQVFDEQNPTDGRHIISIRLKPISTHCTYNTKHV